MCGYLRSVDCVLEILLTTIFSSQSCLAPWKQETQRVAGMFLAIGLTLGLAKVSRINSIEIVACFFSSVR
jgi:hypothetical protein